MAESIARTFFPKLYSKLEKRKQAAHNMPLSSSDISTLLNMQFNNTPLYQSIDDFYSDEYRQGIKDGRTTTEQDKIPRYRPPTEEEINLIYCDIHSREDSFIVSGNNQPDS